MTFKDFIGSGSSGVIGAINTIIVPLIFAFAFLYYVWGVVDYFFIKGDDEKARVSGREFAFWGISGFAIGLSVWGLVNLLLSTLGIAPG